jgi:hypothetical protein
VEIIIPYFDCNQLIFFRITAFIFFHSQLNVEAKAVHISETGKFG